MLYQELLDVCHARFADFFRNNPIFSNQFSWSGYNDECYRLMYSGNREDNIAPVSELKKQIPELEELCSECRSFFIPARNQSLPRYDVIMGNQFEGVLMEFLMHKLCAPVCRADEEDLHMPDCQVLKPDGTTAAYFEVKFHGAPFVCAWQKTGRYCYEGSATLDYKKIKNQLEIIERLEAPVFYVHWIEYPCLKGIFYETSKQLKQYVAVAEQNEQMFERKKRRGDEMKSEEAVYLKKIYPPLLQLKDFESFVEEISALLKSNGE